MFSRKFIIAQVIKIQGSAPVTNTVPFPVNVETENVTNNSFLIIWGDTVVPPTNIETSSITNNSFIISWL